MKIAHESGEHKKLLVGFVLSHGWPILSYYVRYVISTTLNFIRES